MIENSVSLGLPLPRAMDQLIIGLTMTKLEGEFFLKIYSVNNSLGDL